MHIVGNLITEKWGHSGTLRGFQIALVNLAGTRETYEWGGVGEGGGQVRENGV